MLPKTVNYKDMEIFSFFISFLLVPLVLSATSYSDGILIEENYCDDFTQLRNNFMFSENYPFDLFNNVEIKTLEDMKKSVEFLLKKPDPNSRYGIIFKLKKILDELELRNLVSEEKTFLVQNLKTFKPGDLSKLRLLIQGKFIDSLLGEVIGYLNLNYQNELAVRKRNDWNGNLLPGMGSLQLHDEDEYGFGSNNRSESKRFNTINDRTSKYLNPLNFPDAENLYLNPSWRGRKEYLESMKNRKKTKDRISHFSMKNSGDFYEEGTQFERSRSFPAAKVEKVLNDKDMFSLYFGLNSFPFDLKDKNFKSLGELITHLDNQKFQDGEDGKVKAFKVRIKDKLKTVVNLLTGQNSNEESLVRELVKLEYKPLSDLMGLPKEEHPLGQNVDSKQDKLLFGLKDLYESVYSLIYNKSYQFDANIKNVGEGVELDQSKLQGMYKNFMYGYLKDNVVFFDKISGGKKETSISESLAHEDLFGLDNFEDDINEIDFPYCEDVDSQEVAEDDSSVNNGYDSREINGVDEDATQGNDESRGANEENDLENGEYNSLFIEDAQSINEGNDEVGVQGIKDE